MKGTLPSESEDHTQAQLTMTPWASSPQSNLQIHTNCHQSQTPEPWVLQVLQPISKAVLWAVGHFGLEDTDLLVHSFNRCLVLTTANSSSNTGNTMWMKSKLRVSKVRPGSQMLFYYPWAKYEFSFLKWLKKINICDTWKLYEIWIYVHKHWSITVLISLYIPYTCFHAKTAELSI